MWTSWSSAFQAFQLYSVLSGLISDLRQLLGVRVDVVPKEYVRPSHRGMFEDVIPL